MFVPNITYSPESSFLEDPEKKPPFQQNQTQARRKLAGQELSGFLAAMDVSWENNHLSPICSELSCKIAASRDLYLHVQPNGSSAERVLPMFPQLSRLPTPSGPTLRESMQQAMGDTSRMLIQGGMRAARGAGFVLDGVEKGVETGISYVCRVDSVTEQACAAVADAAVTGVRFVMDNTPLKRGVEGYQEFRDVTFPSAMVKGGIPSAQSTQFVSDVANIGLTTAFMAPAFRLTGRAASIAAPEISAEVNQLSKEIGKVYKRTAFTNQDMMAYQALDEAAGELSVHFPLYGQEAVEKMRENIWREAIFKQTGEPAQGKVHLFRENMGVQRNTVARIGNLVVKDSASMSEIVREIAGGKLIDGMGLQYSITGKIKVIGQYEGRRFLGREGFPEPTFKGIFEEIGSLEIGSLERAEAVERAVKSTRLMGTAAGEFHRKGLAFREASDPRALAVALSFKDKLKTTCLFLTKEERHLFLPPLDKITESIEEFLGRRGHCSIGYSDIHAAQFIPLEGKIGVIDTARVVGTTAVDGSKVMFPLLEVNRFSQQLFTMEARMAGLTKGEAGKLSPAFRNAWDIQLGAQKNLLSSEKFFQIFSDLEFIELMKDPKFVATSSHIGNVKEFILENLNYQPK